MLGGYFENQPVLSVIKEGQVIDTIYLDGKDTFLMGRSSDCDIVVGHASTSRQHLEIQVIRATQELILTDLASGHGTCLNGKRLPGLIQATAKESDIIQLAASTRAYSVQWLHPLSLDENRGLSSVLEAQPTPPKRRSPSPAFSKSGSKSFPSKKEQFAQEKRTLPRTRWDNDENGFPVSPRRAPKAHQRLQRSANEENEVPYSPQRTPRKDGSELPPRVPPRRLAFSSLQASTVNARSPRSPPVRKAHIQKLSSIQNNGKQQTLQTVLTQGNAPSSLWLRRCNSAPLPALKTSAPQEVEDKDLSGADDLSKENAIEDADTALLRISEQLELENQKENLLPFEEEEEGYDSEKENIRPQDVCISSSENPEKVRDPFLRDARAERIPFQPLPFGSSQDSPQEFDSASTLGLPRLRLRPSAAVKNLDQMFRKMTLNDGADKRQWHMVVDTSCLLKPDSLKVFGQLQGNKDTRVIIPKIVIRELDGLKHSQTVGYEARAALNWIDSCMTSHPTWIHVQNSSETAPTPPADPSSGRLRDNLMSPTNDDRVLECALLFEKKIRDGSVALLTRDTALKIKAMAEGLTADNEVAFCESLVSPYSERFLWAGSTAHKPGVSSPTSILSPVPRLRNSKKLPSPISGLRQHYNEQPKGLRLLLA